MKADLDLLMRESQIAALLVLGATRHNPAMVYFTGRVSVSSAELIKVVGQEPRLYYRSAMEREEAARTGLQTRSAEAYRPKQLLEQANGDVVLAQAMRYRQMLEELGVNKGRIAIYGMVEAGTAYALFSALGRLMPEIELVSEADQGVLGRARMTKDAQEIEQISQMGRVTVEVVGLTAEFLSSHGEKGGVLVKKNGDPLRIGDVKRQIRLWLAERGAESPQGIVLALGREAAIPHSSGDDQGVLELGKTIVFDIFPCQEGGGYYYDFTRTWCLGYAPEPVQELYEDVEAVYRQIVDLLQADEQCSKYQELACDLFEGRGHATLRSDPATIEGYVHSLGHGVGLQVHERPWFGASATPADRLVAGSVFTIEPGLYYPSKEIGIRLEDTFVVEPDGRIRPLATFPMDLVLPISRPSRRKKN
ncbi:MAG: M24 family metallopeptidase [Anaerolineales bacterium]|nr:M24 family metallopeptidase [Anaerolineales bacterium]MDW8448040.1 M24 family metallopeptidase [Anaerolineales bacterium]